MDFDFEATFGEDYLYFYAESPDDGHSDDDAAEILGRLVQSARSRLDAAARARVDAARPAAVVELSAEMQAEPAEDLVRTAGVPSARQAQRMIAEMERELWSAA